MGERITWGLWLFLSSPYSGPVSAGGGQVLFTQRGSRCPEGARDCLGVTQPITAWAELPALVLDPVGIDPTLPCLGHRAEASGYSLLWGQGCIPYLDLSKPGPRGGSDLQSPDSRGSTTSQWGPNLGLSPPTCSYRAKESGSHRGEVAGPGSSSHGSLACGLGARWRPPWPSPRQALPGPSGLFLSFSVSLSIVSTSGRLVPPLPTMVAARPQRKVPCSSVSPTRPLCPHGAPGDLVETPMSSAHTDAPGREGGGLQLPVGTGPASAWVLVVKDGPWGRTRACG